MAYLSNTSINGDLGVSGLTSVGTAGLKFTSGIINIFGTSNSGGTGNYSISIGSSAAATGSYSVALGFKAQTSATETVAIGDEADTSGDYSIAIGYGAKATDSYSAAIGRGANATGSYALSLGYDAKASKGTNLGYRGSWSTNGVALGWHNNSSTSYYVYCTGSSGSQWSASSDKNDKTDIENIDLDKAYQFITSIDPVTYVYNYRNEYLLDPEKDSVNYDVNEHLKGSRKNNRRNAGVLAQDVYDLEKEIFGSDNYAAIVDYNKYDAPDLNDMDRYSVRYNEFIPFLIASIKKMDGIIKEQNDRITELEKNILELKK